MSFKPTTVSDSTSLMRPAWFISGTLLLPRLLVHLPSFQDVFDKGDQASLDKLKKQTVKEAAQQIELQQRVEEVQKRRDKGKRSKQGKKAKAKAKDKSLVRTNVKFTGMRISVEHVRELLPPGYQCWKDDFSARWQVRGPRGFTVSRSWMLYGAEQAGRVAVQACWKHAGFSGKDCPIAGLFKDLSPSL